MFEVENKYPLSDPQKTQQRLSQLGVVLSEPVEQCDQYYAHPNRDFAKTDEALRIRNVGSSQWLTYKGPRIDSETKTRREIELPLSAGAAPQQQMGDLFVMLGFRKAGQVCKHRQTGVLVHQERSFTLALDQVKPLGTFLEIEILVAQDQVEAARESLASLAQLIGVQQAERRSYLELLQSVSS